MPKPSETVIDAPPILPTATGALTPIQQEWYELTVARMRKEEAEKVRAAEMDRAARKANAVVEEMKRQSQAQTQASCSHASPIPANITSIVAQRISNGDAIRAVCQSCFKIFFSWDEIPLAYRAAITARTGGPQMPGTGGIN